MSLAIDSYTRENRIALEVFHDSGHDEFNGIDGRTLHAFARRGLVWFEAVDYGYGARKRYRGGVTAKGREVLAAFEAEGNSAPRAANPDEEQVSR
ncbi:hypothetical protein [Microbacterium arborescens]